MSYATHVENGVSIRELERILIKVAQTTERAMPSNTATESYSMHDAIYDQGNRKGVVCPWEREEELVQAAATATRSAIDVCLDVAGSYTANRLAPFPRTNCWRKAACQDIPGDWGKRTVGGAAKDTFGNCTGSSFDKFSYNKSRNTEDNNSISNHRSNVACGDVRKVSESMHDQDPTSPVPEKEICGIKIGFIQEDLDNSSKTNSNLDSCNTPTCSNFRQKPFCLLEELFENGLRFIRSWKEEMAEQLHETASDEPPPLPAHHSSQNSESKVRKRQRDQFGATSRPFRRLLKEGLNFIRKWKEEMAMQFPDNSNDGQSPEIDWSLSQLWEEESELFASSHAGAIANASVVPLRSKTRQRPCILRHKSESDCKKSSEYASEYGGEPELMSEHDNDNGGEIDLSGIDSELGITSDDDSGNGDETENCFKNDSKNGRPSEHKCEGDGEKYIDDENGGRHNDNRNSLGILSSCEYGNENDSNVESSNEDVNDSDDVSSSEDDNYSGDEIGNEYYNDKGDENSIEDNDSDDEHSSENDKDGDSSNENSCENDSDHDSGDENSSEHDNDIDSGDENSSEHDNNNDSGDENSSEHDNDIDSGDEDGSEHDSDSGKENSSEHDNNNDSDDENSSEQDNNSGDENSSEHDSDSGNENSSEHDNDSGNENSSEHDNDSGNENSSEHDNNNDSGDENNSEHDNDNDSGDENSSEHDNDGGDENSSKHDNDSGVENNSEHDNDNDSGDENNSEHDNDSGDENSSDDHSGNENRCENDSDDEQISKNINGNYVSCSSSNDHSNISESQSVVGGAARKRPKLRSKEKNPHTETIYSLANSFENAHLVFPNRKEELGKSYEHINKRPQNKNATPSPDWDNSCGSLLKLVLINNMRRRIVSFSQTNGTASSPPSAPTNTVD